MSIFDMHGDATDRMTMRTSNALLSARSVSKVLVASAALFVCASRG